MCGSGQEHREVPSPLERQSMGEEDLNLGRRTERVLRVSCVKPEKISRQSGCKLDTWILGLQH